MTYFSNISALCSPTYDRGNEKSGHDPTAWTKEEEEEKKTGFVSLPLLSFPQRSVSGDKEEEDEGEDDRSVSLSDHGEGGSNSTFRTGRGSDLKTKQNIIDI